MDCNVMLLYKFTSIQVYKYNKNYTNRLHNGELYHILSFFDSVLIKIILYNTVEC